MMQTTLPSPREGYTLVIDVSAAQVAGFDFRAAHKAGVVAAMIKASEGETYVDRLAIAHRKAAADAGLLLGSYHVFRPEHVDPAIQAQRYFDAAHQSTVLGPVIDLELDDGGRVAPEVVATRALAFVQRTAALWEHTVGLVYLAPAFAAKLGAHPEGMKALTAIAALWSLWLADYRAAPHVPPPWTAWRGWQFSGGDKSRVGGVPVDASWFVGGAEDLRALGASFPDLSA